MAFVCTIPAVSTLQQDGPDIRVTRWDFPSGAVTGWHSHAWPCAIVMLTDATMRVHDGTTATETTLAAGQAYQRPAGVEHDVMNGGEAPMSFVEVEIKRSEALRFG